MPAETSRPASASSGRSEGFRCTARSLSPSSSTRASPEARTEACAARDAEGLHGVHENQRHAGRVNVGDQPQQRGRAEETAGEEVPSWRGFSACPVLIAPGRSRRIQRKVAAGYRPLSAARPSRCSQSYAGTR